MADEAAISVAGDAGAHVSRDALKLLAALRSFGLSPHDAIALDVGASTGGFTEVLLAEGAAKVYAVDVGRAQLHERLRADKRDVSLEATDARKLNATLVPQSVTAIVADVSFISLTLALPAALKHAAPGAWLVALIKPQFEAGREAVGKGGIVRGEEDRMRAVKRVREFLEHEGWESIGVIDSPHHRWQRQCGIPDRRAEALACGKTSSRQNDDTLDVHAFSGASSHPSYASSGTPPQFHDNSKSITVALGALAYVKVRP